MGKIRKIVSFFFVVLFINYYAGVAFFYHSHVINDTVITHSHTHTDSHHDTKNGGHTQSDIIFIAQISHFDYIDFSCNCVLKPIQLFFNENKFVETTHWVASVHLENLSLRAPPAV